jgi:cobalt-zinc-cadmium efflux system membrane fusion protein
VSRALVIGVLSACRAGAAAPADQPPQDEVWLSPEQMQRADVRIEAAREVDIPQATTVGGRVAFDDLHVTHVFSPVTGRVTRLLARPGQTVKKGDP